MISSEFWISTPPLNINTITGIVKVSNFTDEMSYFILLSGNIVSTLALNACQPRAIPRTEQINVSEDSLWDFSKCTDKDSL